MSAAEGSVVKAPDHQQQSAEAGMDTPSSNVGVNWSGSQPHVVPPSVLSTCPDSESISILQTTNICFDDLNKTSLDLFAADLHDHTQRETTSLVTKECMSAQLPQTESGQLDATDNSITEVSPLLTVVPSQEAPSQTVTSTGFMTPVTKVSGTVLTASESGSVYMEGKHHSARANLPNTADGIPAADELMMERAMRRTAERNLDGPVVHQHRGSAPPTPTHFSAGKSSQDTRITKLNSIGISLENNANEISVSYNALKRIEVDRFSLRPKLKGDARASTEPNPFDLSDGEDHETDNDLLSHLVKDITEVDLDDLDLDTRICDLKVSGCKTKSSSKKDKVRRKHHK